MATGEIEILVSNIEVLNESETPPFPIESEIEVNEEMRLRYRYIDQNFNFAGGHIRVNRALETIPNDALYAQHIFATHAFGNGEGCCRFRIKHHLINREKSYAYP
jgi:aspartyl-tRNA synthetase